jgi:hypothetical protein
MVTREGGAQAKEYIAKYAADRVRNFSSAWLGATMGCAECHDHKFDPFLTKEFYRLEAFFADIKETAVGEQEPFLVPTPEQEANLKQLDQGIAELHKVLDTSTPELEAAQKEWEEGRRTLVLAEQTAWALVPNIGYCRLSVTAPAEPKLPKKNLSFDILATLLLEPDRRSERQRDALAKSYRLIAALLDVKRKELAERQKQKDAVTKIIPRTLITVAIPPRTIRVLPRGNWLDDSGEMVEPGVPTSLAALNVSERRANRLDLVHWLTTPDNPLVARVFVNRLWKLLFGQGLVKTLDDFGSQGAWPTHPELLDWLAVEFRESGWDIKHMIKLIAMSSTYRQSSAVSPGAPGLRQRDPYNQLLARQGRFRLDAEMVRDNALAVSGLLSHKMLGPSVKPYQPPLYWSYLNFPQREWQADHGDSLYRRSVYTYWCRTFLHPSMLAFDAPTREECCVERPRSNTPLQALVLLNDPEYVEAARAFAERIAREGGSSTENRIQFAYWQTLSRAAQQEEIILLSTLYERHLSQFRADAKAAEQLLHVGERPAPERMSAAELAAWTSVARVIFNLHETITRD